MPRIELMTGNEAIAWGVRLSRPKVISAFPITPQPRILEKLARFIADGELDAEYVNTEGDYSMVAVGIGSEAVGVRTFLSTSGQGFAYGYENIAYVPVLRLPIVMAVSNRVLATSGTVGTDYSDSMTGRDLGWIQYYCETAQEALDTVIQAYRVAEDPRVLLPAMVCISGIEPERYLTHTAVPVEVPDQGVVDGYLPPYGGAHFKLEPERPLSGVRLTAEELMAMELNQAKALERSKEVIEEADREFLEHFGRTHDGLLERYRCEGADSAVLTMGAMASTAREAIDELWDRGAKVGLIRLRVFRPFPREELVTLAKEFKTIAVVDRCLARGTGEGAIFTDLKAALYNLSERPLLLGFVAGLHGVGVTQEDFKTVALRALEAEEAVGVETIPAMEASERPIEREPTGRLPRVSNSSTRGCAGCPMSLAFRHIMESLGDNIVLVVDGGCGTPAAAPMNFPRIASTLPGGAAVSTGVARALKAKGDHKAISVLIGGDGGLGDIGFQPLSGALERNEDILCICLDNEANNATGFQRSGSTPYGAWTPITEVGKAARGKAVPKKNLPLIVAAHGAPYVATASVSNVPDLKRKIEEAKKMGGFRYIHVLTPCHYGWGFPMERIVEVSRLAVETNVWPLYRVTDQGLRITYRPEERVPVSEYLRAQKRFRHLSPQEVGALQEMVDRAWGRLGVLETTKL
ncbi:MAG: thiamine pyrophosphate-dependent enzyme [Candidatus Bathyarchaeia archaeon]